MTRVFRLFEGLLLVLFGGLMLQLVDSGNLWMFLNPKFNIVIGVAGSIILLLGIFLPFNAHVRPGRFRTVVWTLFLLVAMVAVQNAADPFSGDVPFDSAFGTMEEKRPDPVEIIDGIEYRRANLFELYLRSLDAPDEVGHVLTKGMVVRTPEMDTQGKFGVVRIVITCCLADAVAVGFTVTGHPPEDLETGQWVEIPGSLAPVEGTPDPIGKAGLRGVIVTTYSEKFMLRADVLRRIPPPDMPYIF